MSYEVLYRKYRPYTFDDVVGQKHVISTLQSQIDKGTPAHAYLFFGTRGIGKTSIARIFGRTLGISDTDVYEIDAASNRGIDDIRDLRDAVRTLPFESKYKLYIIDEVHMLTKEAFNALLKTLEEPPAHVIFILATTEIEKVPETIVSRCQVYTLESPTVDVLAKNAITIAKKEGYTIDEDQATLIAETGDGSFRDMLGSLQKVLTNAKGKKIDTEELESLLRLPRRVLIHNFLRALLEKDKDTLSVTFLEIEKNDFNMPFFLKEIISIMRDLLLRRFIHIGKKIDKPKTSRDMIVGELEKLNSPLVQSKTLSRLMIAYLESRNSFLKTLPLELAIVDILEEK